jgi:hypothetical protein
MGGKKMATARNVLGKLKSSDGKIRVKTLSGVSALVAAIALLVGVLPAMAHADHTGTHEVHPQVVDYGGGSGACSATIDGRLPSAAGNELHINNPTPGTTLYDLPDGKKITLTVYDRTTPEPTGRLFDFTIAGDSDFFVYDVIVNGGRQNNHYDYDGNNGPGPVKGDTALHAPRKNAKSLHNLSHINICYDLLGVTLFVCGAEPVSAARFGNDVGDFTGATAQVFSVDGDPDCEKRGSFFIQDDEETTLDFGIGEGEVAGRADFTKQFDLETERFEPLKYNGGPTAGFEEVPWCGTDGEHEFQGVSGTVNAGMPSDHTACKVYEEEDAAGMQHTVVYFEFEDPQFR